MARINSVDPRAPNLNPNAVRVAGVQIEESDGTAAGVYRGSVKVPAYAVILDVIVHNEAVWDAGTSATLVVGLYQDDSNAIGTVIDADEIFTATNVKATDLTAGQSISFLRPGGVAGGMITEGTSTHYLDVVDAADRWIVADITTVGTAGTAGKTYIYVVYGVPEMDSATFTAS